MQRGGNRPRLDWNVTRQRRVTRQLNANIFTLIGSPRRAAVTRSPRSPGSYRHCRRDHRSCAPTLSEDGGTVVGGSKDVLTNRSVHPFNAKLVFLSQFIHAAPHGLAVLIYLLSLHE